MSKAAQKTSTQIVPCGHRVIIRPRAVEEVTQGGIVLVDQTKDMERRSTMEGKVVAIGSQAFKGFADGEPWCNVGDTVLFSRYSGSDTPDYLMREMGYNPKVDRLVTVNDEDVIDVVVRG